MKPFFHFVLFAFVFASLVGCDKQGIHPYGVRSDVIDSCGAPASVHLRSTDIGTELYIVGNTDPTTPVGGGTRRCMMTATIARDSSTDLNYGSYELDASGNGTFYVTSTYSYVYQPNLGVSGRKGSERFDFDEPWENPFTLTASGDQSTLTIYGASHEYTSFSKVLSNIDLAGPTGIYDLYQTFNLALFLSQVRIPAFGGLGMTRYIGNTTYFQGLVAGEYSVGVESLVKPTVTMIYTGQEDFPGIVVNGTLLTKVNISGDGPMEGTFSFEMRDPANPSVVAFAGSANYDTIQIDNGLPVSGDYAVTTTVPIAANGLVPFTAASNVDLTNVVPITP